MGPADPDGSAGCTIGAEVFWHGMTPIVVHTPKRLSPWYVAHGRNGLIYSTIPTTCITVSAVESVQVTRLIILTNWWQAAVIQKTEQER